MYIEFIIYTHMYMNTEREREREKERKKERESACVRACVCVCVDRNSLGKLERAEGENDGFTVLWVE